MWRQAHHCTPKARSWGPWTEVTVGGQDNSPRGRRGSWDSVCMQDLGDPGLGAFRKPCALLSRHLPSWQWPGEEPHLTCLCSHRPSLTALGTSDGWLDPQAAWLPRCPSKMESAWLLLAFHLLGAPAGLGECAESPGVLPWDADPKGPPGRD